jgi:muramoyltetrapeptide carboxypeptidase
MSDLPSLSPRDVGIGIVAPSGYAPDAAVVERAVARLRSDGARVTLFCNPADKFERFGARDDERVAQLHAAASDPSIDVVIALRGGYGLSRILPMLDFDLLAQSGKLFVGHSDFTAFQMALLAATGTVSFAGPMICDDFGRDVPSQFTLDHFWQCLRSETISFESDDTCSETVQMAGLLWGGNLAMLAHLVGSPYLPDIDGGILFLEDINEHPFRVERMLLQLLHAGVLQKQQAIVLGDFSGGRVTDYDNGFDFDSVIASLRSRVSVPVLTGLRFGHVVDKVTLPVGAQAALTADSHGWVLRVEGYPRLR